MDTSDLYDIAWIAAVALVGAVAAEVRRSRRRRRRAHEGLTTGDRAAPSPGVAGPALRALRLATACDLALVLSVRRGRLCAVAGGDVTLGWRLDRASRALLVSLADDEHPAEVAVVRAADPHDQLAEWVAALGGSEAHLTAVPGRPGLVVCAVFGVRRDARVSDIAATLRRAALALADE